MKKVYFALFLMLFAAAATRANDGVFYVSGNTLIPLQETQIALRKEVLKFYVTDFSQLAVEVDFEFYNPGKAKKVVVGFVTPPADGDVSPEERRNPRIEDFTVLLNGRRLAYKMKRMNETSFSPAALKIGGEDFVYYFDAEFKRGVNKIRHTYKYQGGASIDVQRHFDYQITTGKRWANRQIDDFELQIHLDNGIFFVPASFTRNAANWQIVGDGIIDKRTREAFGDSDLRTRLVHLNRGFLSLKERNFKPETDIFIGEYYWATGWADKWCGDGEKCADTESFKKIAPYLRLDPSPRIDDEELAALSVTELKYLRNYFFAVRGLDFKDAEVKNFYARFFWYKPDALLRAEDLKLSQAESDFVARLRRLENARR